MTEGEWLTRAKPRPMLHFLQSKTSDRKLRLFAVACCRIMSDWLDDRRSSQVIHILERYADSEASREELTVAEGLSDEVIRSKWHSASAAANRTISLATDVSDFGAASQALAASAEAGFDSLTFWNWLRDSKRIRMAQSHFLRDIFGNPFRPIVADPAWLTPTVQSIAAAIYQDRAFDRLPILADALEEAGCTNADVLLHCRQSGEHVRGCWVVDLVLGKE